MKAKIDLNSVIHKRLYDDIASLFKSNNPVKGIWSVYYVRGIRRFKTLGFYIPEKENNTQLIEKLRNVEIDTGFGSTGWAYEQFLTYPETNLLPLEDTYNDPRGTVIVLDHEMGQQNTVFLALRDISMSEVIGVVMIFGEGMIRSKFKDLEGIFKKYVEHYQLLVENQSLINIQSVFRRNKYLKNNELVHTTEALKSVLNRFLEINNHIELPFLFVLPDSSTNPKYIAFGKQILKSIEYELKFCSYLDSPKISNCHFKDSESKCDNSEFLREFFFEILPGGKSVMILKINGTEYSVQIYGSDQIITITEDALNAIDSENPFSKGTLAHAKYQNERITKLVEKSLPTVYLVCLIKRKEKGPHIINNENCFIKGERSDRIVPTNYLPHYYDNLYGGGIFKKYPPLKGPKIELGQGLEDKSHIIGVIWNESEFYKVLNDHLLEKKFNEIICLLGKYFFNNKLVPNSVIKAHSFTVYGIDLGNPQLNDLSHSFLEIAITEYLRLRDLQKIKLHATRSAISQALLRNYSHNHGSHIMVHLVNKNKITDKEIKDLFNNNPTYIHEYSEQEMYGGNDIFAVQIANFNKYLKNRWDFLSELTFSPSRMQTSISLDEVYRELDQNLLILNYIPGVEGFRYSIKFINNVGSSLDQLKITFPSDLLGCQALYNIIEAVIRNSAKYGNNVENGKETVFSLEFSEIADPNMNGKQLYKVEIFDNREGIDEGKIKEINEIIKSPVIDQHTHKLRNKGLGILEMQACAAFLRHIDAADVDSEQYYPDVIEDNAGRDSTEEDNPGNDKSSIKTKKKLPLLEAFLRNGNLAYRFYMLKPREILVVSNNVPKNINHAKFGVTVLSVEEFSVRLVNGKIFHHQFLLYDASAKESHIDIGESRQSGSSSIRVELGDVFECKREQPNISSLLALLPVRMMEFETSELTQMLKSDFEKSNYDTMEVRIWEQWMKRLLSKIKKDTFRIISGQEKLVNKTEYTICLQNHTDFYKRALDGFKKSGCDFVIEPLSSVAKMKLPGWKSTGSGNLVEYVYNLQHTTDEPKILGACKEFLQDKIDISKKNFSRTDEILNYIKSLAINLGQKSKLKSEVVKILENGRAPSFTMNSIKILESSLNSVIVIDERIQVYSEELYKNISNWDIFHNNNCHVPPKEIINLSDPDLKKKKTNILDYLNERISSSCFLVVHYGLLERIYDDEGDRRNAINKQLSEWSTKIRVVITSGRGQHSLDLPHEVCYINLSPITNVFIENRSKYSINYLLNNSRR